MVFCGESKRRKRHPPLWGTSSHRMARPRPSFVLHATSSRSLVRQPFTIATQPPPKHASHWLFTLRCVSSTHGHSSTATAQWRQVTAPLRVSLPGLCQHGCMFTPCAASRRTAAPPSRQPAGSRRRWRSFRISRRALVDKLAPFQPIVVYNVAQPRDRVVLIALDADVLALQVIPFSRATDP